MQARAAQILVDGRLAVRGVVDGPCGVTATCRDQGALLRLGWTEEAGWHCDCGSAAPCAHLVALQLVVFVLVSSRTKNGPRP